MNFCFLLSAFDWRRPLRPYHASRITRHVSDFCFLLSAFCFVFDVVPASLGPWSRSISAFQLSAFDRRSPWSLFSRDFSFHPSACGFQVSAFIPQPWFAVISAFYFLLSAFE
jgi:hypothetical protein